MNFCHIIHYPAGNLLLSLKNRKTVLRGIAQKATDDTNEQRILYLPSKTHIYVSNIGGNYIHFLAKVVFICEIEANERLCGR